MSCLQISKTIINLLIFHCGVIVCAPKRVFMNVGSQVDQIGFPWKVPRPSQCDEGQFVTGFAFWRYVVILQMNPPKGRHLTQWKMVKSPFRPKKRWEIESFPILNFCERKVRSFQSWDEPISRENYIKLCDETVWYHKIQPSSITFWLKWMILHKVRHVFSVEFRGNVSVTPFLIHITFTIWLLEYFFLFFEGGEIKITIIVIIISIVEHWYVC